MSTLTADEKITEHPDFPLGTIVRGRMNGQSGVVILSRYNRVMVQWEHFVGDLDGWQAGNRLRRVAA